MIRDKMMGDFVIIISVDRFQDRKMSLHRNDLCTLKFDDTFIPAHS